MSEQFTLITTHTIDQGKLDEYLEQNQEYAMSLEANEPNLIYQQVYVDKEQTEVTSVLAFTDAEAADIHMKVSHETVGRGLDFTKTTRLEVYGGTPGPVPGQALQASADAGVPLSVKPNLVNGFTRQTIH